MLYEILKDQSGNSPRDLHRLLAYKDLVEIYDIVMSGGFSWEQGRWEKMAELYDDFRLEYNQLTNYSIEQGALRYNIVTKFHFGWHIVQMARWLNPKVGWTYIFEDFMGKIARSAAACTAGTPLVKVAEKTTDNFRRAKYLRQKRRRDMIVN